VRRRDVGSGGIGTAVVLAMGLAVVLTGCGSLSGLVKADDALTATPPAGYVVDPIHVASPAPVHVTSPSPVPVVEPAPAETPETVIGEAVTTEQALEPAADATDVEIAPTLLSLADEGELVLTERRVAAVDAFSAFAQRAQDSTDAIDEEYDPWESFNEKMFAFNRGLDRWVLKPVARGYMFIMPEPWQVLVSNGFANINFVPRFVNSLLQGKWGGAGRELARFLINSTAGIGGLFDPAKDFWGIERSREDFGQTLGVWGAGPGPYLVLPFMEPLTVRDGIGKAVDGAMDPLSYFLPFIWDRLGMKLGDIVNDRALNYDLFQGFEESVIDMYSAVRHGYLQRRQQLIKE
jgi:phospholipid-binding lipoprotein MlaA